MENKKSQKSAQGGYHRSSVVFNKDLVAAELRGDYSYSNIKYRNGIPSKIPKKGALLKKFSQAAQKSHAPQDSPTPKNRPSSSKEK